MHGDPDKLRRVLINLIANAIDAMVGAGTPDPRLTIMSGDNLAGTGVWLRIQDNGPGMDPETQARIFDPFYTTKEDGTGLGLALAKKVVDVHGGTSERAPGRHNREDVSQQRVGVAGTLSAECARGGDDAGIER